MSKLTKTFLYNVYVGGFYVFRVFKIEDAHHMVYYVAERTTHGATVLADKEEDIRPQLERQVKWINEFWARVR